MTAADRPSVTDNALAEAWAEGHRTGWEHCQDGNYGNDHWDDPTPNPYRAAGRAETTTATTEDAALTIRYVTLDDGTVELNEVVASNAAPGLVTSRPLATARTRPTRDEVVLTIFGTLARHFEVVAGQLDGINAAADAVLALLADQPETTTEWGVRFYGRGPFDVACDSREDAEAEVAAVEDKHAPAVLIRREVTAWTEADQ